MYVIAVCLVQDVLNFGRSGAGAPVRDSQGQVRAVVVGNPEIRWGHVTILTRVTRVTCVTRVTNKCACCCGQVPGE